MKIGEDSPVANVERLMRTRDRLNPTGAGFGVVFFGVGLGVGFFVAVGVGVGVERALGLGDGVGLGDVADGLGDEGSGVDRALGFFDVHAASVSSEASATARARRFTS